MIGLAHWHGKFFDSDRFHKGGDLDWIISELDPRMNMVSEFMKAGWSKFVGRLGDKVSPDLANRGHLVQPIAQFINDQMGKGPQVVVHGDCHLENCYFVPRGDGSSRLGLYDFQLMRRGNPAIDVGCFLAGSFSEDLLVSPMLGYDNVEHYLLELYLDELKAVKGVDVLTWYNPDTDAREEYVFEDLKADYHVAVGLMLAWNVAACLAVPFDTEASSDYDQYAKRLCKVSTLYTIIISIEIYISSIFSYYIPNQ